MTDKLLDQVHKTLKYVKKQIEQVDLDMVHNIKYSDLMRAILQINFPEIQFYKPENSKEKKAKAKTRLNNALYSYNLVRNFQHLPIDHLYKIRENIGNVIGGRTDSDSRRMQELTFKLYEDEDNDIMAAARAMAEATKNKKSKKDILSVGKQAYKKEQVKIVQRKIQNGWKGIKQIFGKDYDRFVLIQGLLKEIAPDETKRYLIEPAA